MQLRSSFVAAFAAILVSAGCVAPPADPVDAASSAAPSSEMTAIGRLDWSGHVVASETDALMHTSPTEGILWPYEQAGIIVNVPEGVSAVEVAVAWNGPGEFRIHLHSHDPNGKYVGHDSFPEQYDENPHCIRAPTEDVAPGHWMVMIHSMDAIETDFTLSVLTEGVVPTLVEDQRHGHDRVGEILAGQAREEHDSEACTMWAPGEAAHEH